MKNNVSPPPPQKKLPCPLQLEATWIMNFRIASIATAWVTNIHMAARVSMAHRPQPGLWLQHRLWISIRSLSAARTTEYIMALGNSRGQTSTWLQVSAQTMDIHVAPSLRAANSQLRMRDTEGFCYSLSSPPPPSPAKGGSVDRKPLKRTQQL